MIEDGVTGFLVEAPTVGLWFAVLSGYGNAGTA